MTRDERPLESQLGAWLRDEAPDEAPDAILDAVSARIDALDQHAARHGWRAAARLLASAAVVAALVVGAWTLRGAQAPGQQPAASPAPRPLDIPRDGTCAEGSACFGLLEPGQHATTLFTPSLRFTVPAGWENLEQRVGFMDLRPVDRPGDVIELQALPAPQNPDGTLETGVGTTGDAFAAWLASRPDLAAGELRHLTVLGTSVPVVEFVVADGVESGPTDCPALPCVAVAAGLDPRPRPTWSWNFRAWRGAAYRVYVVGDGDRQFLVTAVAWSSADREPIFDAAEAIVASLARGTP